MSIREEFTKFHQLNPSVWILFSQYAHQMIASGREHYSANAIFERVRWHVDIETRGDPFKLNNNFRAHYARLFMDVYPQHAGFFRTRGLTRTSL